MKMFTRGLNAHALFSFWDLSCIRLEREPRSLDALHI